MLYKYRCIDQAGRQTSGSLAAESAARARLMLRDMGLSIVEINERQSASTGKGLFASRKSVGDSDLYNMARELSVLLRSGLRIGDSIETVVKSTPNEKLRKALTGISGDIKSGSTVADSFATSGVFSPLVVTIVRVGESVGDLKAAFENFAGHLQFQINFKTEVRNALVYPAFLIIASVIVIGIMFKFIIPRFFNVFGAEQMTMLPLPARILYTISMKTDIYVVSAVALLGFVLVRFLNPGKLFSSWYDHALDVPVLKGLILNMELSRFAFSMHTMLSSGIEFIKALGLSTELVQNVRIKNSLLPAIARIREGKGIADVFSSVDILPDIVVNMIGVGEKSGSMKEIFLELFKIFDDRFRNSVKRLVVLIEPAVILVMGLIVGFVVISLILTVMSVGSIKL
jgi:general secretion pathway protein F